MAVGLPRGGSVALSGVFPAGGVGIHIARFVFRVGHAGAALG